MEQEPVPPFTEAPFPATDRYDEHAEDLNVYDSPTTVVRTYPNGRLELRCRVCKAWQTWGGVTFTRLAQVAMHYSQTALGHPLINAAGAERNLRLRKMSRAEYDALRIALGDPKVIKPRTKKSVPSEEAVIEEAVEAVEAVPATRFVISAKTPKVDFDPEWPNPPKAIGPVSVPSVPVLYIPAVLSPGDRALAQIAQIADITGHARRVAELRSEVTQLQLAREAVEAESNELKLQLQQVTIERDGLQVRLDRIEQTLHERPSLNVVAVSPTA